MRRRGPRGARDLLGGATRVDPDSPVPRRGPALLLRPRLLSGVLAARGGLRGNARDRAAARADARRLAVRRRRLDAASRTSPRPCASRTPAGTSCSTGRIAGCSRAPTRTPSAATAPTSSSIRRSLDPASPALDLAGVRYLAAPPGVARAVGAEVERRDAAPFQPPGAIERSPPRVSTQPALERVYAGPDLTIFERPTALAPVSPRGPGLGPHARRSSPSASRSRRRRPAAAPLATSQKVFAPTGGSSSTAEGSSPKARAPSSVSRSRRGRTGSRAGSACRAPELAICALGLAALAAAIIAAGRAPARAPAR